ncbi:hypothetical protein [Streptomyces lancefieldiae]|uniref:Uncharacterized protein n=1 Tax=Streptomyces lancefieldiae TaxID=3075520 RepID=A0ABU3ASX3_9ACTN|nr:hypothetical protein [Streptomyces sp. DSM 40712]MDT0613286.1 hypothetical protein [Streptomyces sp. DSM 40712]
MEGDAGCRDLAGRGAQGRRRAARPPTAAGRPYTEELFGTAALDDTAGGAQLHHRITSHRAADIDRVLAWHTTLPDRCERFTARATRGATRDVRVTDVTPPESGGARRCLRVTVSAEGAVLRQAL